MSKEDLSNIDWESLTEMAKESGDVSNLDRIRKALEQGESVEGISVSYSGAEVRTTYFPQGLYNDEGKPEFVLRTFWEEDKTEAELVARALQQGGFATKIVVVE